MTYLEVKLSALETRLHRMNESKKENAGAKRKVEREMRNIKKQIAELKEQMGEKTE